MAQAERGAQGEWARRTPPGPPCKRGANGRSHFARVSYSREVRLARPAAVSCISSGGCDNLSRENIRHLAK